MVSVDSARRRAFAAASSVVDPEMPFATIEDLGILRGVEVDGDVATARLVRTYSGCPAVETIESDVLSALSSAGFRGRIRREVSPAWSSDDVTAAGREKLRAHGIDPPSVRGGSERRSCPRCSSSDVERLSEFGSAACRALYRCRSCLEPFDAFKCS